MHTDDKDGSLTLHCFTPAVTIFTFGVELAMALYVIIRYRMTAFGRLSSVMLLLLATFQLAEYAICHGTSPATWAKVAFLSITFLPVIGLHLISLATGRRLWPRLGYAIGTVFIGIILFSKTVFLGTECPGKYVIFAIGSVFATTYGIYYLGFMFAGVIILARHIRTTAKARRLLIWFLIGYLSFIVPTFILYVMVRATRDAFPSILCGFAIIFSIILVFLILPHYRQKAQK